MAVKSTVKLISVIIVIAVLLYVAFYGVSLFGMRIPSALDEDYGIRRGLDLTGGSVITYEADVNSATDEEMETAVGMLRERLDNLGYFEATIARQGEKKIRIEIPSISDPHQAIEELGRTAELKFVDPDNEVVLSGRDIIDAKAQYGQYAEGKSAENYISLVISDEAVQKFSDATAKVTQPEYMQAEKNYIAIMLDEEALMQPRVSTVLSQKELVITGGFTAEDAGWKASLIRAGKLPFSLRDVELKSIEATLGAKALDSSLRAGIIGIVLVFLFMLISYKVLGLVADIALLGYIGIVASIMGAFRLNLTLPGIAGIILGIGMAVDANVIIFERIKEELKAGKTLRASIDAGFKRAFSAIIDSNITTLIAAMVLWKFGTGPIKGFAITLSVSIITSMFTALVVTKFLLKQTVGMKIKNLKLYGV